MRTRHSHTRRTRLVIERLEDRTVPSFTRPPGSDVRLTDAPGGPVAVGDFTGDGFPDLIQSDPGAAATSSAPARVAHLSLYTGSQTGGFGATPTTFTLPSDYFVAHVGVGRFNGDAIDDVVVAGSRFVHGTGWVVAVSVFVGGGPNKLTLKTAQPIQIPGFQFGGLAVGSFVGNDTLTDVAILPNGPGTDRIPILRNAGDATFVTAGSGSVGGTVKAVINAAVVPHGNGDGRADLAAVVIDGNNQLSARLFRAEGDRFRLAETLAAAANPSARVAVGDLNGDRKADLAVLGAQVSNNKVATALYRQLADGTFEPLEFPHIHPDDEFEPIPRIVTDNLVWSVAGSDLLLLEDMYNDGTAEVLIGESFAHRINLYKYQQVTFPDGTPEGTKALSYDPVYDPVSGDVVIPPFWGNPVSGVLERVLVADFDPTTGGTARDLIGIDLRIEEVSPGVFKGVDFIVPVVNKPPVPPEIGISASASPSKVDRAVTFQFQLTPPAGSGAGVPDGTVEMFEGGTSLGPAQALAGGVAEITLPDPAGGGPFLAEGTHTFTVRYTPAGDDFGPLEAEFEHEVRAGVDKILEPVSDYSPRALPENSDPAWTRVQAGNTGITMDGSAQKLTIVDGGDGSHLYYERADANLQQINAAFLTATFRIPKQASTTGSVSLGFSDTAKRYRLNLTGLDANNNFVFAVEATGGPYEVRVPNDDQPHSVFLRKFDDGTFKVEVTGPGGYAASTGPIDPGALPDDATGKFLFGAASDPGRSETEWLRVYGSVGLAKGEVAVDEMGNRSLEVDRPAGRSVRDAGQTFEFQQGNGVGVTIKFATPSPAPTLKVTYGRGTTAGQLTETSPFPAVFVPYTGLEQNPGTEFHYVIQTHAPGDPEGASPVGNVTVEASGKDGNGGPITLGPDVFFLKPLDPANPGPAAPELRFADGELLTIRLFKLAGLREINDIADRTIQMVPFQVLEFTATADPVDGHPSEIFFNGDSRQVATRANPDDKTPVQSIRGTATSPAKLYVSYAAPLQTRSAFTVDLPFAVVDTVTRQARRQTVHVRVVGADEYSSPAIDIRLSQPSATSPEPGQFVEFTATVHSSKPLSGDPREFLEYQVTSPDGNPTAFSRWPVAENDVRQDGENLVYSIRLGSESANKVVSFRASGATELGVPGTSYAVVFALVDPPQIPPSPPVREAATTGKPLVPTGLLAPSSGGLQPGDRGVPKLKPNSGKPVLAKVKGSGDAGGIVAPGAAGGIVAPGAAGGIVAPGAAGGIVAAGAGGVISRGGGSIAPRGVAAAPSGPAVGERVDPNASGMTMSGDGWVDVDGNPIAASWDASGNQNGRYLKILTPVGALFLLDAAYGGFVKAGPNGGIVLVKPDGTVVLTGDGEIDLGDGLLLRPTGPDNLLAVDGHLLLLAPAPASNVGAISLLAGVVDGALADSHVYAASTRPDGAAGPVASGQSPTPGGAAMDTLLQAHILLHHAGVMQLAGFPTSDFQARLNAAADYVEAGQAVLGADPLTAEQTAALAAAGTVLQLKADPAVPGSSIGSGGRIVLTLPAGVLPAGSFTADPTKALPLSLGGVVVTAGGSEPVSLGPDQDNPHIQLGGQPVPIVSVGAVDNAPGKVVVRLPNTLPIGERLLIALTTPDGKLAFTSVVLDQAPVVPKNTVTITEPDGDKVTVKLVGLGTLGVNQDDPDGEGVGPIDHIHVTGTKPTSKPTTSQLVVTVAKGKTGDGLTNVGSITGSDLKGINAPAASLIGTGVYLTGYLGGLTVRDIKNGADVIALGTTRDAPTTITAHDVSDGSAVVLQSPVQSLTVARFGAGAVAAPSLGMLSVKGDPANKVGGVLTPILGDFLANLTLTGTGDAKKPTALGSATVAGNVSGTEWDITGGAGIVTVKGAVDTWKLGVTGAVAGLTLGDAAGADVTIGGTANSVSATRWAAGSLTAAAVGTLTVSGKPGTATSPAVPGDLKAALTLKGTGDPKKPAALGSATVAGSVAGATWDVKANAGNITVKGATDGWTLGVTGSLTGLTVVGDLKGNVTVGGAGVPSGRPAVGTVKVGGAVAGSRIVAGGSVTSVTAGAFRDSALVVGFVPTNPLDPLAGGTFAQGMRLGSFSVTGLKNEPAPARAAFDNSYVAAETVGTVALASVDPDNSDHGGMDYGILAHLKVGGVTVTAPKFKYDPTKPTPQADGDFQVRIV